MLLQLYSDLLWPYCEPAIELMRFGLGRLSGAVSPTLRLIDLYFKRAFLFTYLVGADGPSPGVLLALAGSSLFESDLVDLLRSFALQKKDKNFLPKTIRTTMKAVAITIITMTKGILAAPSVLNG